jgi:5-methylcytosine-specific restriction enzyme subunit McrC
VIQLAQHGVSSRPLDARSAKKVVLRRNDREDAEAIDAARLLLDMNIPMEDAGNRTVRSPLRDATTIRRLYERAVRGFYQAVLRPNWFVSGGETHQRWPITESTAGLASILPIMRTDIQLERSGRRIIVETLNRVAWAAVGGMHCKPNSEVR